MVFCIGALRARIFKAFLIITAMLGMAGAAQAQYTQTQYPVVLVHGMLGFESIGPIGYFYGVPQALRAGGATVFTPAVSALESSEARGEQLLSYLQQLRAAYGYTKFNLIGHSHGGPTARYVAAVAPDMVASVTTMGSPHLGTVVADVVESAAGATGSTTFVAALFDALGSAISYLAGTPGNPQNALGTMGSLTTSGAAKFNVLAPAGKPTSQCGSGAELVHGVRYFSASGVAAGTNVLDLSDPMLILTSTLFGWESNDGLVSRCSSHWGTVLRDDFAWNHLDEVNQAFGLRGWFSSDPVQFYRTQANRLKGLGL